MSVLRGLKIPSVGEIERAKARKSHIDFMEYTWQQNGVPFIVGFHTEEISKWLDQAFEKYRRGISSYAMIRVPFRHGKSQLISRSAVPHFLGEFPEGEVIVTSYNTQTAQRFSKDAKTIIESKKFLELYPNSTLNPDNKGVAEWGMSNRVGGTLWSGLDGSLTGSGANFGIVDDPFKGRAEANSELIREKRWESFTEAFMTRLAPVHIVLVVATPWHTDDFFGRIDKRMKDDPLFPRFESLTFPAKSEDYKGKGKYRGTYLFPERFPDSWYEGQYATLGAHASSGLLDCSPTVKGGNLIPAKEGVNWHWVDQKPDKFTRLYRCWDLASTKQRAGNDPDWTVGVKLAIKVEVTKIINPNTRKLDNLKQVSIYIDDIIRIREDAVNRNNRMVWTASNDGQSCINFVESFGAQKDTVVTLKGILGGSRIVKGVRHTGDKEYKITEALEVPFTNGTVFVNRNVDKKVWNECCKELEGFPFASHDDLCLPHYSLIGTPNGHVKISGISKGDKVYSFVNSQRVVSNVTEVVYTGVQQVYKFTLSDNSTFECNAHHPILTNRGWVKARSLRECDLIAKDSKWLRCSMGTSSQMQVKDIINRPLRLMEDVLSYIDTSGNYSQDSRFQQVFTSIILMETEIITILRTYNYCSEKTTPVSITKLHRDLLNVVKRINTLSQLEYLLRKLKKVYTSVKQLNGKNVSMKDVLLLANIAVLKRLSTKEVGWTLSFAQLFAGILGGKRRDILPKKTTTYVSNVIKSLLTTSHAELFVPNLANLRESEEEIDYVTMIKKEKMGMVAMYNLVVEDTHNFVSDGVITHNCDALAIGVNELTGKQYSAWWVSK